MLYLSSEDVEVVGRSGAVDNLPVDGLSGAAQVAPGEPFVKVHRWGVVWVLIGHLQIALHPTAAVLGALAIIAVRQQHHQASLPQPLGLPTGQELVKDHLQAHMHR